MLAYLLSAALLAQALLALVGADARPHALLALAPLAVMLAYLRSPTFLAIALLALVGPEANGCRHRVFCEGAAGAAHIRGFRCPHVPEFSIVLLLLAPPSRQVLLRALDRRHALRPDCKVIRASLVPHLLSVGRCMARAHGRAGWWEAGARSSHDHIQNLPHCICNLCSLRLRYSLSFERPTLYPPR